MLKDSIELKICKEELEKVKLSISKNDRLSSLGSLVAGFTHDLSTPVGLGVTGMSNFTEETNKLKKLYDNGNMTQENFENYMEKSIKTANLVLSNLQSASALMLSFKQISVDQTSELKRRFNLHDYFDEVVLSLHHKLKKREIEIKNSIDKEINIDSYAGFYAQIFTNLILNSTIHAFDEDEKGLISVSANIEKNHIIMNYKDNGHGMSNEILKKIFIPFFTTKIDDGGSGLGAYIIYDLVKNHLFGDINVNSLEQEGTSFKIKLPLEIR